MDLPGGPHFKDVTNLFNEAAEDIDMDTLVMAEGYTLYEAMSAVEVGDPRMDSGAVMPEELQRPDFDPLTPLLPEEVSWILDRIFACEMEWHAGNTLSQTVHTCLYMHHLTTMNPMYIARGAKTIRSTQDRPLKLISVVVRAAVLGMVKCCDMAYRELVKGNVFDREDWQGEKVEVSLYEGTPVNTVLDVLEDAERWLQSAEAAHISSRHDIARRLALRKIILRLFAFDSSPKSASMASLVAEARRHLNFIRSQTPPNPTVGSPAYAAFDPLVVRQLHSVTPLRSIPLPSPEETWLSVAGFLDGWEEISRLASCESILAWNAVSNLRTCLPNWSRMRIPYIRSTAQSLFSDGTTVLHGLPYLWLVDHFFLEIIHTPLSRLFHLFEVRWVGVGPRPFDDFQRNLSKLLLQYIWTTYHNRPRHRRHLMKTALEWHALYDSALTMASMLAPKDTSEACVIESIPLAVLHWRLGIIRDIVLSGFELDLYYVDERPFAYWHLFQISTSHERILRQLIDSVPIGSPAHHYLTSQVEFTAAIGAMSAGTALITLENPKFDTNRRWIKFLKRYKWAMRSDYETIQTPDVFRPDFVAFLQKEREVLSGSRVEAGQSPEAFFYRAKQHLLRLGESIAADQSLQLCREDFSQHLLSGLVMTCDGLEVAASLSAAQAVEISRLTWISSICPWFPQCKASP